MLFGHNPHSRRGRHVRSRVQVFFRVDPAALAARLPEGVRPRPWRGCVLGELRFTRLNSGGVLLGPLTGKADHYSCRFAAEIDTRDGPRAGSWMHLHRSSSWFEAVYDGALRRHGYERSRFLVTEEPESFTLHITDSTGSEVELHAGRSGRSSSLVLPSPRAVLGFLGSCDHPDPILGDLDHDLPEHLTPEPVQLEKLDARVFGDFPADAITIDSAWRWVGQRRVDLTETAFSTFANLAHAEPGRTGVPAT